MSRGPWLVFVAAALCVGTGTPLFAQFTQQTGVIPGAAVWTSGVTTFDADGDGDLDVVFANGEGFSSAGTKRAPSLLINTGVSGGNPTFVDQASTRFPAGFTLNAKGVIAFDMENDGDLDLFFAVAFGQSQKLLRNNGSGVFADVTATNFVTTNINSWGAAAFDMDNDGDRDIACCDNTGTGINNSGRMRLYENDGTGDYTEVTTTNLPANTKASQQNVTAVDIDNDMDLDLVLDGRSTPQFTYLNDGTGNYTIDTALIPAGSSNCYETDWSDLDGDGDLDGFYISLSGFNEGTARNNLAPSGTLSFTGSTATISGTNGQDDNEILFIDFDDDGDLDPIVGSLANDREKLYRNNGNFTFTYTTLFSAQTDSTLDVTCGDYDGDGDYDVITAQGESGNFANRYYRNTGVADTKAPTLVATKVTDGQGPFVILAKITDATMDDGDQFVSADLAYTITPLTGSPVSSSTSMRYSGGAIYRAAISSGLPSDLLGANVSYAVTATDGAGNSTTFPSGQFKACGTRSYGTGEIGSTGMVATIGSTGTPSPNGNFSVTVTGVLPNQFGVLFSGSSIGNNMQAWGTIIVGPPNFLRTYLTTNAAGVGSVAINVTPAMVGTRTYYQFAIRDAGFGGNVQASDGLEVVFCP